MFVAWASLPSRVSITPSPDCALKTNILKIKTTFRDHLNSQCFNKKSIKQQSSSIDKNTKLKREEERLELIRKYPGNIWQP